jgi:hypothetical protein
MFVSINHETARNDHSDSFVVSLTCPGNILDDVVASVRRAVSENCGMLIKQHFWQICCMDLRNGTNDINPESNLIKDLRLDCLCISFDPSTSRPFL